MRRIKVEGPCDLTVTMFGHVRIQGIDPDRAVLVIRRGFDIDVGDVFMVEEVGTGKCGPYRSTVPDALTSFEEGRWR